jgi:hypothetical protein
MIYHDQRTMFTKEAGPGANAKGAGRMCRVEAKVTVVTVPLPLVGYDMGNFGQSSGTGGAKLWADPSKEKKDKRTCAGVSWAKVHPMSGADRGSSV